MKAIPYTLTNESISVIAAGKPRVAQKGSVLFNQLRAACLAEDWDAVESLLEPKDAMVNWLNGSPFSIAADGRVCLGVEILPDAMQERMKTMADAGEDPMPIACFYQKLARNPSARSVEQLFGFLKHTGIPIEPDGTFLAYKGVNENFTDCHSGLIDNSVGTVHKMPRNKISDDPRHACHFGFHVGALSYAGSFGPRTIVCRVDPMNVVCVPYDESERKMRVCEYEVIGHHVEDGNSEKTMSSTVEKVDIERDIVGDEEWGEEDAYGDDYGTAEAYELDEAKQIAAESAKKPRRGKNRARAFKKMDAKKLFEQTIDDLRLYATKTLKIVGASKLSGGKSALISRIVRVRRGK